MASFGETLRRERELRGIALAEIAKATKIGTRFLKAIEDDRVDVLPGGMFTRAFVRQYAAFVGLDVERTLAEFVHVHASHWVEAPAPAKRRSPEGRDTVTLFAVAAALGVGLLLMGRSPTRPRPVGVRPPAMGAAHANIAVVSEAAKTAGLVLQLRAEEACWIETQVDGQTVLSRVLNAGETTSVQAVDEILLAVGNAGGIELTFNGQPGLPLGRRGEVRRNVRITRDNLTSFVRAPTAVALSGSG